MLPGRPLAKEGFRGFFGDTIRLPARWALPLFTPKVGGTGEAKLARDAETLFSAAGLVERNETHQRYVCWPSTPFVPHSS